MMEYKSTRVKHHCPGVQMITLYCNSSGAQKFSKIEQPTAGKPPFAYQRVPELDGQTRKSDKFNMSHMAWQHETKCMPDSENYSISNNLIQSRKHRRVIVIFYCQSYNNITGRRMKR